MKKCGKCDIIYELSLFYKDKSRKSGYDCYCKKCRKQYEQSKQGKVRRKKYYASTKGIEKKKEWRSSLSGMISEKRYRQSEKRKQVMEKYNQSEKGIVTRATIRHKRRTKIKDLSKKIIREIYEQSDGTCYYCGIIVTTNNYPSSTYRTIEHIIPIVKGGTNDRENLVICCCKCNCSKNNKDMMEFLNTLYKITVKFTR